MANRAPWRRTLLAVFLLIGFYALALTILGALVFLPYAEWVYLHRADLAITIPCILGALGIAAGILPRFDRFQPPGPVLLPDRHPELYRVIQQTAAAARQPLPRHVYLIPGVNAWVAERGGIMGFGSERVMGLGLPLMQALTVSEFRGVLAHEFGHFYGGDTVLGPWLYKTRAAIGRTLGNLSRRALIRLPFEWYAKTFLRITHAVSREQEYSADALAARIAGIAPVVSGLKTIHALAPAFEPFWMTEMGPALEAGIRPPMLEGFHHFITAPAVARRIQEQLAKQLTTSESDPYDTHPPLKDRLAALPADPVVPDPEPALPALSLLNEPGQLEESLLTAILPKAMAARLVAASWTELGSRVWLPRWTEAVRTLSARLGGLRAEELGSYAETPAELAVRLGIAARTDVASERHITEARYLAGAALVLALTARGFTLSALPGEEVTLTRDDLAIMPFALLDDLKSGKLSQSEWRERCVRAGLHGLDLGTVLPPASSGTAKEPPTLA
jgi:Zn-dependent protease with chaperone function